MYSTERFKKIIEAHRFSNGAVCGGYEIVFLCTDGAYLCFRCARDHMREITHALSFDEPSDWAVVGKCMNDELAHNERCAHCERMLDPYSDE